MPTPNRALLWTAMILLLSSSGRGSADDRADKKKTPPTDEQVKRSETAAKELETYINETKKTLRGRFMDFKNLEDGLEILKVLGTSYAEGEFTKKSMLESIAKTRLAKSQTVPEAFRFARHIATKVAPDLLWNPKQGSMTANDMWEAFEKLGVDLPPGAPLGIREFEFRIDNGKDTAKGKSVREAEDTIKKRYPKAKEIRLIKEIS